MIAKFTLASSKVGSQASRFLLSTIFSFSLFFDGLIERSRAGYRLWVYETSFPNVFLGFYKVHDLQGVKVDFLL